MYGKIKETLKKAREAKTLKKQAEIDYVAQNCGEPLFVKGKTDGSDQSGWGVYSDGRKEYVVSIYEVEKAKARLRETESEA